MTPTSDGIGGWRRVDAGWRRCEARFGAAAAGAQWCCGSVGPSRPLSAVADAKWTDRCGPCCRCSCCGSPGGWRADRLPAGEGLDDDHRGAAVRADEGGLAAGHRRRRRRRRCGGDDVQQLACLGEMLAAAGVGEQAVVADAVEAAGQDVQQEAAHELVGLERHGLVPRAALGPIVLPAEGDAALVHGEQAAVGDGHPVGVTRQIGEHRGRPGEGALGIDDPFTLPQWCEPGGERPRVAQPRVLAEELQPAGVMRGIEFFEEAAAEQSRQHPHRQEEARLAGDPPFAVGGEAPAGTMPCTCG